MVKAGEVDFVIGGYLFTTGEIAKLCIQHCRCTPEEVELWGPIDAATLFFSGCMFDCPNLFRYRYKCGPDDALEEGWLLPCQVMIVAKNIPQPGMPFDNRAQAYAERWFPQRLHKSEDFKDVSYIAHVFKVLRTYCLFNK